MAIRTTYEILGITTGTTDRGLFVTRITGVSAQLLWLGGASPDSATVNGIPATWLTAFSSGLSAGAVLLTFPPIYLNGIPQRYNDELRINIQPYIHSIGAVLIQQFLDPDLPDPI